jgi:hypothetical protein
MTGWRTRGVGAGSIFGAALGAGLVMTAGCGRPSASSPEGAALLLVASSRTGDRAAVLERLGPATRARIDALAAASRRMTGRVIMKPEDFLSVGWAPPAWEVAGTRVLRRDDTTAEVEVHSATGDRHVVSLVRARNGGPWLVELPGR